MNPKTDLSFSLEAFISLHIECLHIYPTCAMGVFPKSCIQMNFRPNSIFRREVSYVRNLLVTSFEKNRIPLVLVP